MHALTRAYNPTLRILFEDECVKVSFNIFHTDNKETRATHN